MPSDLRTAIWPEESPRDESFEVVLQVISRCPKTGGLIPFRTKRAQTPWSSTWRTACFCERSCQTMRQMTMYLPAPLKVDPWNWLNMITLSRKPLLSSFQIGWLILHGKSRGQQVLCDHAGRSTWKDTRHLHPNRYHTRNSKLITWDRYSSKLCMAWFSGQVTHL